MRLRPKPPTLHPDSAPATNQPRLAIEHIPIDRLSADGMNARVHSKKQISQIARSMRAFAVIVPIIADADFKVVCGHGRLLAARQLGLTELPVIRVEHLSPAQRRAFQIADNRLSENAQWDQKLLAEAFRELVLLDIDLDLTITGFEVAEIDLTLLGADGSNNVSDIADEPAPVGPPITGRGDLWLSLGHRVLCADALDPASLVTLMGEDRAALVLSDPPYNVRIRGHVGGRGKIKHAEFVEGSGEKSPEDFTAFLLTSFKLMAQVCEPGALAMLFMDWRHLMEVLVAGRAAFASQHNLCVWAKTLAGQGSFYRSQHELVLVFNVTGAKPRNNIELGRHGRNRSNLWTYPSPACFGHAGEEGRLLEAHPTPKPVALLADAILDCTARGDIVLDCFLGGGATLVAAERTARRCHGIEIEPKFVDAALRRLRRLTGEDPRRASDGKLFSQLEMEAGHAEP